jgi:hypothetical protein
MKTNFANVKADFPAALAERKESIKAGKVQILSISNAINNPLSGWNGKRVMVLELQHRHQPILTTENLVKGCYQLSEKVAKNLPPLEVNGEFNAEQLYAGIKNGTIVFVPATS